jgi:hypothetical protein
LGYILLAKSAIFIPYKVKNFFAEIDWVIYGRARHRALGQGGDITTPQSYGRKADSKTRLYYALKRTKNKKPYILSRRTTTREKAHKKAY